MFRPTYLFHVRPGSTGKWSAGLWPIGMLQPVLGLGAVIAALCLDAHTVNAETTAKSTWCVETAEGGGPPDCTYDNYLTCVVAAIRAGGLCKVVADVPAEAIDPSRQRAPASSRRSTQSKTTDRTRSSSLSAAKREKLFREFDEWSRRRANQ